MLSVGDSLAGYEIVAPVKSGGMGALYVARRRGVGGFAKDVAIKVIHPHLASDEDFVKMFLDEARLTAGIDHPNVIHVHDAGFEDGYYFMVMELVAGCSLADVLLACADAGVRLAPRVGVAIARHVAAGLHAAHELRGPDGTPLGLVHRDVTPDNVMLGTHGTVKLIDFGIAKAAERFHVTRGPTLKGKLRYVAPEQLSGKSDRRTDLFALGAVIWEALTGLGLNEGVPETELLKRARAPVFPPPSETARNVGPELDAAVATLLAADPDTRPETAAAAQALLARAEPAAQTVGAEDVARLVDATMRGAITEVADLIVAIPRIGGAVTTGPFGAAFTPPPAVEPPPTAVEPPPRAIAPPTRAIAPLRPAADARSPLRRWVVPVAIVAVATIATISFLWIDDARSSRAHLGGEVHATGPAPATVPPTTAAPVVLSPTPEQPEVAEPTPPGDAPTLRQAPEAAPVPTVPSTVAASPTVTAPRATAVAAAPVAVDADRHRVAPRTSSPTPPRTPRAPRTPHTPTLVDGVPLSEDL